MSKLFNFMLVNPIIRPLYGLLLRYSLARQIKQIAEGVSKREDGHVVLNHIPELVTGVVLNGKVIKVIEQADGSWITYKHNGLTVKRFEQGCHVADAWLTIGGVVIAFRYGHRWNVAGYDWRY